MRDVVGQRGRIFDLSVLSPFGRAPGDSSRDILESALFASGRPVLVAPPEAPETFGNRILIAWNRGVQSARAVAGAMDFIKAADQVLIGYVDTGAKQGPSPEDLAESLAWHGVGAEVKALADDGGNIGALLLGSAHELGADLVVMGAYSHYRLREMVLGGVTSHVVANTDLPVLMTH